MADGGDENLRKQIAFLSNLIGSHKSGKQNENPVVKPIQNSKSNKTWSRWKNRFDQNRQLNHGKQGNKVFDSRLSRNTQNVKGYISGNKVSLNRKVSTHNPVSNRLQASSTTAAKASTNKPNMTAKSNLSLVNQGKTLQIPAAKASTNKPNVTGKSNLSLVNKIPAPNIMTQNDVPQVTNQQKGNSSMKYKLHRKLASTKLPPPAISDHTSSTKTTSKSAPTKAPLASSCSVTRTPFKMVDRTPSGGHSKQQPGATLNQPKGNLKWTKNEKINSQSQVLRSASENKSVSSNPAIVKNLTNPLSSSFTKCGKPLTKATSLPATLTRHSSSSHSSTTSTLDRRTAVALPKAAKPLTKATSLPATLTRHSSSSHSSTTSTLDRRTAVAFPKAAKPLTKATNTTSTPDKRVVVLPKSYRTNPKLSTSSTKSMVQCTTTLDRRVKTNPKVSTSLAEAEVTVQTTTSLDSRTVHLPKQHKANSKVSTTSSTGNLQSDNTTRSTVNNTTSLDRRPVPLPKSHRTNPEVPTTTTKGSLQPHTVSKGAKLKWRRKSAGKLMNDSVSKIPRSKNLYGNELQTRITLKSKWRKAKPDSTTPRKAISNTGVHHPRTTVNHISTNATPKGVFHSPHTKTILQSRTIPRRSRLKWSKSLSQTSLVTKSDQSAARKIKPKFAHNSRFSLKRRKSSEGKSSVNIGHLGSSRVQVRTGAISKVRPQNKGFVSRRMKYIALGYQSQNKSSTSKYSLKTSDETQLRRKIKIGGSLYLVSSHGKTLKKTAPLKDNKTNYSTVPRNNSVHVYRRANAVSSTNAVQRIFKRQNSVDKKKTRKANKILKRTVQAVMKKVKKQKSKSEEYCMFFNKFGKCTKHKQGICPYMHDPTKIAVCTRFLRGKCQQMDGTCPFSHKIDKEKMPICQYFLKGKCNRDDCPYSHVNVGRQAVVCEDFLKGYCSLGFKCKKKHVLECEEFSTTGQCPNKIKCKLIHRKKVQQQRKRYFDKATSLDEEDSVRDVKRSRRKSSDGFLPLEGSTFSEDERLTQSHNPEEETELNVSLRIRPNFATKESNEKQEGEQ